MRRTWLSLVWLWVALPAPAGAVVITTVPAVNVASGQVTVWWRTDVSSSTELYFGTASAGAPFLYPNQSVFAAPAGTLHSRTLSHLPPGQYYLRARSADSSSFSQSPEVTFTVPDDPSVPLGRLTLDRGV